MSGAGFDGRYDDEAGLKVALNRLSTSPPLVTSWEIERLRGDLADAAAGRRLVLVAGDCAETFDDCRSASISARLKVLLRMSLVLVATTQRPVVRIGRLAGQYAKPRSEPTETRQGADGSAVTLPSYFGDLVNGAAFDADIRRPDPRRLVDGYHNAALTLNFVRSLLAGGFADLHAASAWDAKDLLGAVRVRYEGHQETVRRALAVGDALDGARRPDAALYTSHEGLHLGYEGALTREVPRRAGHWCLSTHFPWIGDRTRQLDGKHVAFFAACENPVAVKLGPKATGADVCALAARLDPSGSPGRLTFVTRLGSAAPGRLPELLDAGAGLAAGWLVDPMHGNTRAMPDGRKVRFVDDVVEEIAVTARAHRAAGTRLSGLHLEVAGEDVTECVGCGVVEADLRRAYGSACDPRLNPSQAVFVAEAFATAAQV